MHKRTTNATDRAKNGIANERRKGMLKKQKKLFLDRFNDASKNMMHIKQIKGEAISKLNQITKHKNDLLDYFHYYFSKKTRLDNMISTKSSKNLAKSYHEANHQNNDFIGYRLMKHFKELCLQHKYIKKLEQFKKNIGFESFDEEFRDEVLEYCRTYCAFAIRNSSKDCKDFILK